MSRIFQSAIFISRIFQSVVAAGGAITRLWEDGTTRKQEDGTTRTQES